MAAWLASCAARDFSRFLASGHRITVDAQREGKTIESFFGTLKKELIYRRSWPTRNEAAAAVHEYIEVFYNRRRRHTTNGGKAPAIYEALAAGVPTLISAIPVLTSQFPHLPAHAGPGELRRNLSRTLEDPQYRNALVESSRDRLAWVDITRHDTTFKSTVERLLGR